MADVDSGARLERDLGIRRKEDKRRRIWREVERRETVWRFGWRDGCFGGSTILTFLAFRFLGQFWFLQEPDLRRVHGNHITRSQAGVGI